MTARGGFDEFLKLLAGDAGITRRLNLCQWVAAGREDFIDEIQPRRDELQLSIDQWSDVEKLEPCGRQVIG